MKTTVEITRSTLDQARELASREKTTLRALIEEGLSRVIAERKKQKPFKLRKASFRGKGLHPDAGEGSWPRVLDMIYKDRGA